MVRGQATGGNVGLYSGFKGRNTLGRVSWLTASSFE